MSLLLIIFAQVVLDVKSGGRTLIIRQTGLEGAETVLVGHSVLRDLTLLLLTPIFSYLPCTQIVTVTLESKFRYT